MQATPAATCLTEGPVEAASAHHQQAVAKLQSTYADMAAAFQSQGLDMAAIAETSAWFNPGEADLSYAGCCHMLQLAVQETLSRLSYLLQELSSHQQTTHCCL